MSNDPSCRAPCKLDNSNECASLYVLNLGQVEPNPNGVAKIINRGYNSSETILNSG